MDQVWRKMGLSDEEYQRIKGLMGRDPNHLELGMFGVMWSEHCSYKNSKPILKKFPTEGEQVLQGPGENAGIVDIGDNLAVAFKVESHNHPSAVDPFAGSATGIGGVVRDIFAMGARPVAALASLRFGSIEDQRVRFLLREAVAGAADYCQGLGIPLAGGEVKFAPAYQGNPLVNAMCVGVVNHDAIATGKAAGVGNPVLVLGAATGRDGVEGATFASEELEIEKEQRSTVPQGNPELERRLIEVVLELLNQNLVEGMQDLGAAGFTSAGAEMATRAGTGLTIDVNLAPKAHTDLTPYELMLAETQERMLVVVSKGNEGQVEAICQKWDVSMAVIGQVTDTGLFQITAGQEILAQVPATALTDDAPVYQREGKRPAYLDQVQGYSPQDLLEPQEYNDVLLNLLASPNIADKGPVYGGAATEKEQTVVAPGSDAGVVRVPGTKKGIAMTTDGNGRYCYLDPFQGGQGAVAEAARNIVCSGARPLALTDGLNFGNPENSEVYWTVEQMVEGMASACRELAVPVVSGNVSGYNESRGQAIYPTPIVGMVGLLDDVDRVLTQGFKTDGDIIVLLGVTKAELGGSEYLALVHNLVAGEAPQVDLKQERSVQELCLAANTQGILHSAHDCAEGGLAVAVAESCLTASPGPLGAELELNEILRPDFLLFSESHSRIIVSLAQDNLPQLQQLAQEQGVSIQILGRVTGDNFRIGVSSSTTKYRGLINLPVSKLQEAWNSLAVVMEGNSI